MVPLVDAHSLSVDEFGDGATDEVAAERVELAFALGDAEHALVLPAERQQRAHRRPRTPLRQRPPMSPTELPFLHEMSAHEVQQREKKNVDEAHRNCEPCEAPTAL